MSESETSARVSSLLGVVRRAFVLRRFVRTFLAGAIVVSVIAVALAVIAPSVPRFSAFLLLPLLALFALVLARRSLPDDTSLVWYVDKRLGANELLLTFYDGARSGRVDPGLAAEASARLVGREPRHVRPRRAGSELFAVPFVAALVALTVLWPVPAVTRPRPPRTVRLAHVQELDAVERLPELRAEERAERERIAQEARALRRALEQGMTAREAIERVDRLREQVASLRTEETSRSRRAREAAIEALSSEREMADALASRDLEALSRATERAAARREASDRQRAREALSRAAAEARREGDDALAESLLSRERLLSAREEQAALARELAEAMPELSGQRMRRALETLARDGDAGALDRQMVDAMRDAWQRLTPEERRRLAEAMSRASAAQSRTQGNPGDARPDTPGEPAPPPSADDMERQLRAALENLDHLEMRVGGRGQGIPMPGGGGQPQGGQRAGSGSGQQPGQGGQGAGPGGGGPSPGGGGPGGPSNGSTAELPGDPLLARVRPLERAGAPSQTFVDWATPDAPQGGAALPPPASAGAGGDPNAVTRARVPEEYREHVRTYFGGGQ